jgi:hypothetical protein
MLKGRPSFKVYNRKFKQQRPAYLYNTKAGINSYWHADMQIMARSSSLCVCMGVWHYLKVSILKVKENMNHNLNIFNYHISSIGNLSTEWECKNCLKQGTS